MSNRIAEWRTKRGWKQSELADAVGTSPSQINKLESGDRKLTQKWLDRLAVALDCLPAELLPEASYRPYLSSAEERILNLYRSLDDVEQLRWMKAFAAYCSPIEPKDIQLTD